MESSVGILFLGIRNFNSAIRDGLGGYCGVIGCGIKGEHEVRPYGVGSVAAGALDPIVRRPWWGACGSCDG